MDHARKFHELLLQRRTQIRNHKNTKQLMKKCWRLVPHEDLESTALTEFEDLYSMLLYEMTICWKEELNGAILAKMWQRDASSFQDLSYDRFCCSLFFYAELWVDEVTQAAYDGIFNHIRQILSGHEPVGSASTTPSAIAFKPTLESFNTVLDGEKVMEELNMNIGKSIFFDAAQYYHHFGSPEMPLRRVPSPTRLLEHRPRCSAAEASPPSRQQFGATHQTSLCQHSQPSPHTSRLHLSLATPRTRPMPSSPTSRSIAPRSIVDAPPRPNDDSGHNSGATNSSDPHFVLTGKSAFSPTRRTSNSLK